MERVFVIVSDVNGVLIDLTTCGLLWTKYVNGWGSVRVFTEEEGNKIISEIIEDHQSATDFNLGTLRLCEAIKDAPSGVTGETELVRCSHEALASRMLMPSPGVDDDQKLATELGRRRLEDDTKTSDKELPEAQET